MVPEAYGAQVLPDPDYGPKKDLSPLKQTFPTTFVLYNFRLVARLRLQIHPKPCLGPPDPGGQVQG